MIPPMNQYSTYSISESSYDMEAPDPPMEQVYDTYGARNMLVNHGEGYSMTPAERDELEQQKVLSFALDQALASDEYRENLNYLEAYWECIHPVFPILHRDTFMLEQANPLLRATMLALGAHCLGQDKTAISIHESCLQCLREVWNDAH